MSVQTGDLPDIWKSASITPVFKKGLPSDRPITDRFCLHVLLVNCLSLV